MCASLSAPKVRLVSYGSGPRNPLDRVRFFSNKVGAQARHTLPNPSLPPFHSPMYFCFFFGFVSGFMF